MVQIRATVGLTSSPDYSNDKVADLFRENYRLRLTANLSQPLKEQTIDIRLTPEHINLQRLIETYHLSKRIDPVSLADPGDGCPDIVSVKREVSFQSVLRPCDFIPVIVSDWVDIDGRVFKHHTDRLLMTTLARGIWESHLACGAPLKAEYLPAEAEA